MVTQVPLLIIGAGPYGLAMAAYATHRNLDYVIIGKPMDFWKSNMPKGLLLRSPWDWHIDPLGVRTIREYARTHHVKIGGAEPIPLDLFVRYAAWFQEELGIQVLRPLVHRLEYAHNTFEATLESQETVVAKHVLVAPGFRHFAHIPTEFTKMIPAHRFSHSCDLVRFEALEGKRCLIIGGRQSAFEWAALLHEHGAAAVHVSHRHATPKFEGSDWSWVSELVEATVTSPDWYRKLSPEQREELSQRFWAEGRLKLEPWLAPRITNDAIKVWPRSRMIACTELPGGELEVKLDVGQTLRFDYVILATGYKVDVSQIPYLARGNILKTLRTNNGYPMLDASFQSNIPGLYFTSLPATHDFGPFFGFVIGAPVAARMIGSYIERQLARV
jgi:cation diffusion facilitator CzcD-associated flavoprotein CzcO